MLDFQEQFGQWLADIIIVVRTDFFSKMGDVNLRNYSLGNWVCKI